MPNPRAKQLKLQRKTRAWMGNGGDATDPESLKKLFEAYSSQFTGWFGKQCSKTEVQEVYIFWRGYEEWRKLIGECHRNAPWGLALCALDNAYNLATLILKKEANTYGVRPSLFCGIAELTLANSRSKNGIKEEIPKSDRAELGDFEGIVGSCGASFFKLGEKGWRSIKVGVIVALVLSAGSQLFQASPIVFGWIRSFVMWLHSNW